VENWITCGADGRGFLPIVYTYRHAIVLLLKQALPQQYARGRSRVSMRHGRRARTLLHCIPRWNPLIM
jgi:hypothetical protein